MQWVIIEAFAFLEKKQTNYELHCFMDFEFHEVCHFKYMKYPWMACAQVGIARLVYIRRVIERENGRYLQRED